LNSTKNQAWKTATFEHQNATTNRMAKRQRCSSYLASHSQRDIADTLHVNKSVISRDMVYLKQQAEENLKTHNQDKLPEEYQNCMTGINQVLKICWEIVNKSKNVNNDNDQTVTITDNKTILQ
jgi:hypothetical protein